MWCSRLCTLCKECSMSLVVQCVQMCSNEINVLIIDWTIVSYRSKFSKKSGRHFYLLYYKICSVYRVCTKICTVCTMYSVYNKIGFADMAPRFRQMPTSSYQPITLILLTRKMTTQIRMTKEMIYGMRFRFSIRLCWSHTIGPEVMFMYRA